MKKIEEIINKELDEALNDCWIPKVIKIDVMDYEDFDEDLIDWKQVTFNKVIEDVSVKNDYLILELYQSFVSSHNNSYKEQCEEDELELKRQFWNDRF